METQPEILHQSPQWLVLNKPSGWLTIPGRIHAESESASPPVLSEWAKSRFGSVWVTHRIDRETSGLVLFALTAESHRQANLWFEQRKMKKYYLCLAQGTPSAPVSKISQAIEGAHSVTQFEVKEKFTGCFLAKVHPVTGRRHQIRIHFSTQGYPLLGDTLYHGPSSILLYDQTELKIGRVALHASSLELPSGERFEAPLPEDFKNWLDYLRKENV